MKERVVHGKRFNDTVTKQREEEIKIGKKVRILFYIIKTFEAKESRLNFWYIPEGLPSLIYIIEYLR